MSILQDFLKLTDGIQSPYIFRKWAALTMLGGILERRVWVTTMGQPIFPNMFVLLIATPGIGKSLVIEEIEAFWYGLRKFSVAPSKVTKEKFTELLGQKPKTFEHQGKLHITNTMLVAGKEFGIFIPDHDTGFLNILNELYDCGKVYRTATIGRGEEKIDEPCVTIFAGTQPKFLSEILPEMAWGMGFTSRMIMIYESQITKVSLFKGAQKIEHSKELLQKLRPYCEIKGEITWSPEAQQAMDDWYLTGSDATALTHSRLIHYNTRRHVHILKLCMIFSLMRDRTGMKIEMEDFENALETLLEAEETMTEVFVDMSYTSDSTVLDALQTFLITNWMRTKKPVAEHILHHFLKNKVPAYKIPSIIKTMIESRMMVRVVGVKPLNIPFYKPNDPTRAGGTDV